jgi:hypothetical protein
MWFFFLFTDFAVRTPQMPQTTLHKSSATAGGVSGTEIRTSLQKRMFPSLLSGRKNCDPQGTAISGHT